MDPRDELLLEEDSTGYLMSVSDMMAGLLFVFILTLVAFIISFQAAKDDFQSARDTALDTVEELSDARQQRRTMLEDIERTLREKYGINVIVDPEHGILRIPDRAVSFPTARAVLAEEELYKLERIAAVLADVVACYAAGEDIPAHCDPAKKGELDAALVEGHTDNVPISEYARYQDNLELSTVRAAYTYRNIVGFAPILAELMNAQNQPIFSVSGYGAKRPVVEHDEPTNDPRNRRIDLRFLMAPPSGAGVTNEVVRDLQRRGVD